MNYATKIKELYPYANNIARIAGVAYPDSSTSPGALWLMSVVDSFASDAAEIMLADYPSDEASERADGHVSGEMTYRYWQVWTDLALWQWESETDNGPVDRTEIRDLAETTLYEVASRLYQIMLQ